MERMQPGIEGDEGGHRTSDIVRVGVLRLLLTLHAVEVEALRLAVDDEAGLGQGSCEGRAQSRAGVVALSRGGGEEVVEPMKEGEAPIAGVQADNARAEAVEVHGPGEQGLGEG